MSRPNCHPITSLAPNVSPSRHTSTECLLMGGFIGDYAKRAFGGWFPSAPRCPIKVLLLDTLTGCRFYALGKGTARITRITPAASGWCSVLTLFGLGSVRFLLQQNLRGGGEGTDDFQLIRKPTFSVWRAAPTYRKKTL